MGTATAYLFQNRREFMNKVHVMLTNGLKSDL